MYGGSVRGPRNLRQGAANQDAWTRASGAFGHMIGVCDGMGSRAHSDTGAKAACRAMRQAARLWPQSTTSTNRPDPTHVVRLVEILWRLGLAPRAATDCACTCLFALREPDGHLLLAGLGDGLAVIRKSNGDVATFGGRSLDAFGDETLALGTPHRLDDWWIATEPPGRGRTVVLATDGVADDLAVERLDAFTGWLADDIGTLAPAVRWRRLCRELRTWPVDHHLDDKTVAVLVERPGGAP